MSEAATRVANIFRQANEAKVGLVLVNSTWSYQRETPFHCTFESKRDGMEIKGHAESDDPLQAIIDAWEKFESLALRGDRRLITPQLEAPRS